MTVTEINGISLREAWEGMNALLGQRVYTTAGLTIDEFDPEGATQKYILTPDEVRRHISLNYANSACLNPDPRSPESIEELERSKKNRLDPNSGRGRLMSREDALKILGEEQRKLVDTMNSIYNDDIFINDTPTYFLVDLPLKERLCVERAEIKGSNGFQSREGITPMHQIGEEEGIAVVHYYYETHSCHMSTNPKDSGDLTKKMLSVGFPEPIRNPQD
jgi:hypothetical protein